MPFLEFMSMSITKPDTLKIKIGEFLKLISMHAGYWFQEVKKNPSGGSIWWFKNRRQYQRLNNELTELRKNIDSENFDFTMVYKIFNEFNFREEIKVQAEWYFLAHKKLIKLHQDLFKQDILTPNIFRPLMIELKYIVEANEFHKEWLLQKLQQKVIIMYQQLMDQIDQLKKAKLETISLEKKKLVVEEKKTELESIKTQKQAIALQKEKAEILKVKVMEEKLLKQAQRLEHIEAQKLLEMEEEKNIRLQAQARKAELEKSMQSIAGEWDKQVTKDND